ncbi:hypothetical protein DFO70_1066 [Cytobacillus firmus]|uniref:Uncharacterized protein n=2 Tax=Cytobacillus TaxID=2675230 RepID=A0A366JUJ8_CYTFI|nr:hypothetical protein DFO70_1066 [Cytobacillus firmus]TDX42479.1 hypothetical protein DFO72_1066 [Cytobacillus oceanisediminis]
MFLQAVFKIGMELSVEVTVIFILETLTIFRCRRGNTAIEKIGEFNLFFH